jgi:hypothetical protein
MISYAYWVGFGHGGSLALLLLLRANSTPHS